MKKEDAQKLATHALDELTHALSQGKSDCLEKYLKMLSRFPQYSLGNCMLIASQCPEASHVAGFKKWQTLGRQVRKGEKGIVILAPLIGKRKDAEETHENEKAVFGFRAVHVFDVSQTDGEDLPELERVVHGDIGDKLSRLEQVVLGHGIELEYYELEEGTEGLSTKGKVIIDEVLPANDRFAVLAHELAHELLHQGCSRPASKVVRETEAEAVAFVVCESVGLDTSSRSKDYIQLYNGDSEILSRSLDAIGKVASSIIEELTKPANNVDMISEH